jgi:hypothetical protein
MAPLVGEYLSLSAGLISVGFSCARYFVQAWWLRRVSPSSWVLWCFLALAVLNTLNVILFRQHDASRFAFVRYLFYLFSLIRMRYELQVFFRTAQPKGFSLDSWLALIFGDIYFQYHLHKIARLQRPDQNLLQAVR